MKKLSFGMIAISAFILFTTLSCNKTNDEKKPVLTNSYTGSMHLKYSKGFPEFTSTVKLDVIISKEGQVTFTGGGNNSIFDAEDVKYEDGKPVLKIRMTGTLTFYGALGSVLIDNGNEFLLVAVNSSVNGQMTVWGYDDEMGWIQVMDIPFIYTDKYNDGDLQFSIAEASFNGDSVSKTLPDIEGTFTYGYTLLVTPLLK